MGAAGAAGTLASSCGSRGHRLQPRPPHRAPGTATGSRSRPAAAPRPLPSHTTTLAGGGGRAEGGPGHAAERRQSGSPVAHTRTHIHTLTQTHALTRTLPGGRQPGPLAGRPPMADRSLIEGDEPLQRREEAPEWGYEEGVEWGLIFPDANGEYQSPINLNSREAKYDPSLLEVRLSPNYVVCRDCEVINDGHSIQIALKSKSVLIGGPLPRGHEFELHDVRFHWGRENQRGSEHTVNFKAFPMELHLMHWNSTLYSSIDEAVGKKHGIAIIALFVQIGKEHVGLKAVTEILQDIQYKGKSKTIPCFNPNSLLPDPLLRDYWVYEGSLTIPPCSEGVTWILFRYPLTVSQVQIEEFRRLRTHVKGAELLEGCDGILGDNFRPTQPLSDRVIRAAFQ
ncbi:carbonic anhydrase-related protein isoform X2 [Patagioenas fasciata]|uniref:carbonic anhydrase-related protein isoform X2 n=1 Tax=Patagioenas fasciata TaxID=372321 RepID=UPI003A998BD4